MKEDFLDKNKKTINLPIAIGDTFYMTHTTCGNFCLYNKELFDKLYPDNTKRCNSKNLCHTVKLETTECKLDWNNIILVLENWNTRCFKTKNEAELYINTQIEYRRNKLISMGFLVNENGQGYNQEWVEAKFKDALEDRYLH